MNAALLIAGALIFAAGWCACQAFCRRRWENAAYHQAHMDLADDEAIARTFRVDEQRAVSRWQ